MHTVTGRLPRHRQPKIEDRGTMLVWYGFFWHGVRVPLLFTQPSYDDRSRAFLWYARP